jgi:hypothetical protein
MKKNLIILISLTFCFSSFSQTDTMMIKKQKGFLFLSNYNYLYDYEQGEVKSVGFFDFFYPSEHFDSKCLLDSNKNTVFKNGIRVEFFKDRKQLKKKAMLFNCVDTSKCYLFENFYVLPVTIDYKIYQDYEPFLCRRNFYELQVINGSKLRFEYLHKAISILRIAESLPAAKMKTSTKTKSQR